MKAVFDVRPDSKYKDEMTRRYHFPDTPEYLDVAHSAVGDWVLFREPKRRGGRGIYIAAAEVISVEPDLETTKHSYANVANFLEFPTTVPLKLHGRYAEALLRDVPNANRVGSTIRGKSLRPISAEDFDTIVLAGLSETLAAENAVRLGLDLTYDDLPPFPAPGMADTVDRRVEAILVNRKIRDANFRLEVCRAYDDRCAVTGLRIINGHGRSEVQAAHIKPVAGGGPDVVQNGIALSATVHWLFDRHLISIDPDYRLLVSHNRVPTELRSLFRPDHEGLHLPKSQRLWPHPAFLAHHREAYANVTH